MWSASLALAFALAPAPDCGQPDAPPDPRCGESLDGRVPAPDTSSPAGRAVLAVPRAGARVVLWPVLKTSEVVEEVRLRKHEHLREQKIHDSVKHTVVEVQQDTRVSRPSSESRPSVP